MTEDASKWFEYIRNPHIFAVKQYLIDVLKERYGKHDDYVVRLSMAISTAEDVKKFGELIADIYESGFLRAYGEYQEELKKLGYNLNVKPEAQKQKIDAPPIFPQEKSG